LEGIRKTHDPNASRGGSKQLSKKGSGYTEKRAGSGGSRGFLSCDTRDAWPHEKTGDNGR